MLLGKKLSKSVEGPAGARQEAAGRYLLSGNAETGKVLNVIVVADPLAQVDVAAEQWVAKDKMIGAVVDTANRIEAGR